MDGSPAESGLTRSVWSDADFAAMGWHDVTIHGLYVRQTDFLPLLLFDIDYIVRWVKPVRPDVSFTFWVAPATLVFDAVSNLAGEFGVPGWYADFEIDAVHRHRPDGGGTEPEWHIDGHAFDMTFRSPGFRQYIRQPPRHIRGQTLSEAERGGSSFAETGFG
jgi:hypothetical protein